MFGGKIQIQAVGLLVAILALSGCGGSTTLVSTPAPTPPEEQAETVDESALVDVVDEEATKASPDPSPSLGSRQQPAPVGSTAVISDASGQPVWEITLLESALNVNDIVARENQFNDPLPEGSQYAAATFSVTYLGAEKGFPGMDLSVAFVTADGTTHKETDVWVSAPDRLSNENELYQGGTAEGRAYIAIPSAGATTGTWRISQFLNDSEFFFAAQ